MSSRSSNTPESRYIVFVPSCSRWVFIWWSVNVLAHTHTITPASPFLQRLSGWGQYTMYCQPTRCYTVGLEFGPAEAGEGYVTWAKSPADRWPQVCCPSPSPELSCALHPADKKAQFASAVIWPISQDWGPETQMREKSGPSIRVEDSPSPLERTG